MGEYLNQIPENIQDHVRQITKSTRLPDSEESVEAVARGWIEKKRLFEEQITGLGMEEIEFLDRNDSRGALVMTYSGSLLNIGPLVDGFRKVEYASIGLRKDVPETAAKEDSELSSDIDLDSEVYFSVGPIRSSSPVYKIAIFSEQLAPEQQEERLSKATQILTADFIEANKTHLGE
jgi:hypothetical protein